MNIVWYGQNCFKIQGSDAVLITDPFSKEIGLKPPKTAADIVTISNHNYKHNNLKIVKGNPFVIDGAGEYEVRKTVINGIDLSCDSNGKTLRNVAYSIEMNEIRIFHLGDLKQKSLTNTQLEKIGQIDLLFIPIGGAFTIDWKQASVIINQIEPSIVVPMSYKTPDLLGDMSNELDTADSFCKEYGISMDNAVNKLVVKKNDLSQDEVRIILMLPFK